MSTSTTAPFPSWPPETGTFPLAFAFDQPTTGNEPWCPRGWKRVDVWTFSNCVDPSDPCSAVSPGLVCLSMALGNVYGGAKRDQLRRNMIEEWLGKKNQKRPNSKSVKYSLVRSFVSGPVWSGQTRHCVLSSTHRSSSKFLVTDQNSSSLCPPVRQGMAQGWCFRRKIGCQHSQNGTPKSQTFFPYHTAG